MLEGGGFCFRPISTAGGPFWVTADILRELGRRRIPIHYGADELAEDLSAIAQLDAK